MIDYSMLRTEKEIEEGIAVFKNPSLCRSSLPIYKINWNGEEIFFGITNNKLAVFSTYCDKTGKTQMKLYGCREIGPEQSKDNDYLKRKANHALTNLIEQNKQNYLHLRKLRFPGLSEYLQAA
jgi:hypothetical protein